SIHADAAVMRGGEERVAGAEAGADDAELFVTLLLEPVITAARVKHGLARGVDGASDVGRDGVVRTLRVGGAASVMIRQTQTQHANTELGQDAAKREIAFRFRVPVRQQDDRLARRATVAL